MNGEALAARRLDGARLDVALGPLLPPILARAVGAYAARADLPLDRVDDAILVADALSAAASSEAVDGRLALRLDAEPGVLHVRVGPLRPGGAERLMSGASAGEAGNVLHRLAGRVGVRASGRGNEYLVVAVGDETRGGTAP